MLIINNIYDSKRIGERLRQRRKELNLSQEDVALRCHCVRQRYAKWEQGNIQTLSLDDLVNLCNLFQCDIGYILCEYDTKRHVVADIHAQTGLSEKAIECLTALSGVPIKVLSLLLCQKSFLPLLYDIYRFAEYDLTQALVNRELLKAEKEHDMDLLAKAMYAVSAPQKDRDAQEYKISTSFIKIVSKVIKEIEDSDEDTKLLAEKFAGNEFVMFDELIEMADGQEQVQEDDKGGTSHG